MSSPATLQQQARAPMIGPDGQVRLVPNHLVADVLGDEESPGELAIPMRDSRQQLRWVPSSQVKDAQDAGGKVDFSGVPQEHVEGFWGAAPHIAGDIIKGMLTSLPKMADPGGLNVNPGGGVSVRRAPMADMLQSVTHEYTPEASHKREEAGYGPAYRALAPIGAAATGVNLWGMEEAAGKGDTGAVAAHAAGPAVAVVGGAAFGEAMRLRSVAKQKAAAVKTNVPEEVLYQGRPDAEVPPQGQQRVPIIGNKATPSDHLVASLSKTQSKTATNAPTVATVQDALPAIRQQAAREGISSQYFTDNPGPNGAAMAKKLVDGAQANVDQAFNKVVDPLNKDVVHPGQLKGKVELAAQFADGEEVTIANIRKVVAEARKKLDNAKFFSSSDSAQGNKLVRSQIDLARDVYTQGRDLLFDHAEARYGDIGLGQKLRELRRTQSSLFDVKDWVDATHEDLTTQYSRYMAQGKGTTAAAAYNKLKQLVPIGGPEVPIGKQPKLFRPTADFNNNWAKVLEGVVANPEASFDLKTPPLDPSAQPALPGRVGPPPVAQPASSLGAPPQLPGRPAVAQLAAPPPGPPFEQPGSPLPEPRALPRIPQRPQLPPARSIQVGPSSLENPPKPKPQPKPKSVANNASGESSGSLEAQGRVRTEAAKKVEYVKVDVRKSGETKLANTVDRVDSMNENSLNKNEVIIRREPGKPDVVHTAGSDAARKLAISKGLLKKRIPADAPPINHQERTVEELYKNYSKNSHSPQQGSKLTAGAAAPKEPLVTTADLVNGEYKTTSDLTERQYTRLHKSLSKGVLREIASVVNDPPESFAASVYNTVDDIMHDLEAHVYEVNAASINDPAVAGRITKSRGRILSKGVTISPDGKFTVPEGTEWVSVYDPDHVALSVEPDYHISEAFPQSISGTGTIEGLTSAQEKLLSSKISAVFKRELAKHGLRNVDAATLNRIFESNFSGKGALKNLVFQEEVLKKLSGK